MAHSSNFVRRTLAALAFALPLTAFAQNYPTQPITLVIPFAAGGITDTAGRIVAEKLAAKLGQPVVVENRGGAGARIGASYVAKSAPDGYTLLLANSSSHASSVATAKDLPYDPIKDFAPMAPLFYYSSVLVCNPNFPAKTVRELIDYAKKNPGMATHGSAGPGSGNHFMGELFNSLAGPGVNLVHVPYRGSSQAMLDTIAGNTSCTFDGAAKQYIDSGKVRPLAVTGLHRDPRFPNVPTLDESGLKGYEIFTWQGLVAPKGTPPAILHKVNQAINEILADPAVKRRAAELGLTIMGGKPEQLTKLIIDDVARYKKIVKDSHLSFN
jgi:tripartite-type tricarboxylate transporter receptor subunit TctC